MEEQKKSLGVDGDHQSTGTGGSARCCRQRAHSPISLSA